MTLDEAIEIQKRNSEFGNPEILKAQQLGIEALERLQLLRKDKTIMCHEFAPCQDLLPSETDE